MTDNNTRIAIILLLLFTSCGFSMTVYAQLSTFEKSYGTPGLDKARSVCQTYDGGFALTGLVNIGSNQQLVLLKVNQNGDSLWSKIFTNSIGCDGWSIKETFDRGFIIGGYIYHQGMPQDLYILKTDSIGNVLWSKTLTDQSGLFALSVVQDSDSNYAACGYVSTAVNPDASVFVCKLNLVGDTIWTRTYSSGQSMQGWYIENTNDGNYIVTGIKYSVSANLNDVALFKIDRNGNTIWQKVLGGINSDFGLCVKPTMDNCYLISGYSTDTSFNFTNALLIKADSSGNLIWLKTFPAIKWKAAWSFAELPNFEGYIITGQENISSTDNDVYLLKTDTSGNQIWSSHIGHPGDEHGHAIILTSDGGFAVSGFTRSIGNGDYDLYLIKTDSSGNILTDVKSKAEIQKELTIYPNPVSSKFTINLSKSEYLTIINMFGEIKISKYFSSNISGQLEVDVSLLSSGIYFLRAGNVVKKFVKN